MNIGEGASYEPDDVEEALKDFLGRELGFHDARREEMQRVHRSGKSKNGKPWPILARFLRYKDVTQAPIKRNRLPMFRKGQWGRCRRQANRLPDLVSFSWHGPISGLFKSF